MCVTHSATFLNNLCCCWTVNLLTHKSHFPILVTHVCTPHTDTTPPLLPPPAPTSTNSHSGTVVVVDDDDDFTGTRRDERGKKNSNPETGHDDNVIQRVHDGRRRRSGGGKKVERLARVCRAVLSGRTGGAVDVHALSPTLWPRYKQTAASGTNGHSTVGRRGLGANYPTI